MIRHVEDRSRELVSFLLGSLGLAGDSDDTTYDKLWTLRTIGKRSEVARQWIQQRGGVAAVAQAMAAHSGHMRAQKEGAWLCYVIGGLDGVVELLRLSRGGNTAQQVAATW